MNVITAASLPRPLPCPTIGAQAAAHQACLMMHQSHHACLTCYCDDGMAAATAYRWSCHGRSPVYQLTGCSSTCRLPCRQPASALTAAAAPVATAQLTSRSRSSPEACFSDRCIQLASCSSTGRRPCWQPPSALIAAAAPMVAAHLAISSPSSPETYLFIATAIDRPNLSGAPPLECTCSVLNFSDHRRLWVLRHSMQALLPVHLSGAMLRPARYVVYAPQGLLA